MSCCGGGDNAARKARELEDQRQARIQSGVADINNIFSGFNDKFYKGRADAYTGYALPQFTQQFGNANRNLTYALADRGLTNSSAARKQQSDLSFQGNVQKQGIIDTGAQQANQLRSQVEGQRSNLISQLQASADPATSSQLALSQAQSLSLPSTFAPLGNLFSNYAKNYALNAQAQAYNQAGLGVTGANNPLGASSYKLN